MDEARFNSMRSTLLIRVAVAGETLGPGHMIHANSSHGSKLHRKHQDQHDALQHIASPSRHAGRVVSQLKAYYTFFILGTRESDFSESGTSVR